MLVSGDQRHHHQRRRRPATMVLRGLDIEGVGTGISRGRAKTGRRSLARSEEHLICSFNSTNGVGIASGPSRVRDLPSPTPSSPSTGGAGKKSSRAGRPGRGTSRCARSWPNSNPNFGLRVDLTGNTGPARPLVVDRSQFVGGMFGSRPRLRRPRAPSRAMITNSLVAQNSDIDIHQACLTAVARVGNTTVTRQRHRRVQGRGRCCTNTYASSRLDGNTTDGTFDARALPREMRYWR